MPAAPAPPRLHALTLEGYRCFAHPERLELRPITLLYGRNNAGKSAMLRALAVLARSVSESAQGPWDLGDEEGPGLGASFRSLPWRGDGPRRHFSLTLEWKLGQRVVTDGFTLEQDDDLAPAYVRSIRPDSTGEGAIAWERVISDDPGSQDYRGSDGATASVTFVGMVPSSPGLPPALAELADRLRSLRQQVQWIHGGRVRPPRHIRLTGTSPKDLRPNGEDASKKLVMDQVELLGPVSRFYSAAAVGRGLRVDLVSADTARLILDPLGRESWKIELVDSGEGMGKVLPVLVSTVAAARSRGPRIVGIEDPEVHLHDDATRALAEFLAELAAHAPPGVSFVLETHSRTFQLAIRTFVRRGLLPASKVNLVWAEAQQDGHTKLTQVELTAAGAPKNSVLRQAFREDGDLASELAGLQVEQGAEGAG